MIEDGRDEQGRRDIIQHPQCGVRACTWRGRPLHPWEPPTLPRVATKLREVVRVLELYGASPAEWDV